MYKRGLGRKRVVVAKLSCASIGVRENISEVSKDADIFSNNSASSEEAEIEKENFAVPNVPKNSAYPVSNNVQVQSVLNNPVDPSNLQALFLDCGMDIDAEPFNILQLDQAVFLRNLNTKLYSSNRGNLLQKMNKLISCLKEYFSSNDKFFKALTATTTASDCDVARGSSQDSLIRLLLQIDNIQTELTNFLLDKLAELALQSEIDFESDMTPITWVRLILQPFRYLNYVVDSKNMCERLFDIIFSSADKLIQQEVVICLPDIICDTEIHFAATELSKLLKVELELMPHILDALTNLSVQSEIRKEVRRNLIETLKSSPIEYLPNIVHFLLSTCDNDSYDEVINGLRKELFADDSVSLKNTMNEENVDVEGVKVLIFNNIRNCLLAKKQLADVWTKSISHISRDSKCRPLDLLVTVILYDICTESTKKRAIETVVRNRIKNELFITGLIEKTFEHFTSSIVEYFTPLMSLLSKLLKSVETSISDFVTAFYLASFHHTSQQTSRTIIKELSAYVGAGDTNDAQTALNILSTIANKFPTKIRPMASMLRVLLNKLTDLPLKDVQHLSDMLCNIAFSEAEDENDILILKAEITTLIEKQISSTNIKLSRVGIISAVMAIKHIAGVTDEETNVRPDKCSDDFDENALTERAKRALPFLRLLIDGTRIIPEAQGFGFDQFALMLKTYNHLDKTLMFYTSIVMKENMKKYFLICNDEVKELEFVECALKFGLNEDDEFVVLNLTPTLVEEMNSNSCAGLRMFILVLPSLLRLIRELECGDLREIDGLLECPVVMPAPSVLDEFSLQSPEVQVVVMDSLFYLTNWFREIVNCFARLIKQPSGRKVLVRLRTLIWLQKLISKYLPQLLTRDYCPPKCHFHRSIKVPSVGSDKKKKKKTSDIKKKNVSKTSDIRKHLVRPDATQPSAQQTIQDDSDPDDPKVDDGKSANMKNYKQFFRELDWDIWVMLSLPLTLEPEPEKDWQFKPEFGPSELLFIMEDLVEKIQFVLINSTKKVPFKSSANPDMGLTSSSLYVDVPELFVTNLVKLTPRLNAHLESLAQFCQTLLTNHDNILDATGMFAPETVEIKSAYSLILKAFSILFSWPGFDGENNQDYFTAALAKISSRLESGVKSTSRSVLIKNCVTYFAQFQDTVLHLECALNLVSLIEVLNNHNERCREICKISGNMCWNFLTRRWYDWNGAEEKGATFNKNIEYLLTTYFKCVTNKIKAVQQMTDWLKEEVTALNNKDSSLSTIPNINKGNCNILLRVMLKALATGTKEVIDADYNSAEKLDLWCKVLTIMEFIVTILKIQSVRSNLICFVKGSSPILRLFLNHGIATCSSSFRNESTTVVQVLKTSQSTTRYLQKIFDNTKLTEDSALCANLPTIRSLLEALLLKVKEIVVMNGCSEAFFVGSMRNKDIQGQDILSQSTVDQDSERMDVDDLVNNDNDNRSIEIEDDAADNDEENDNIDDNVDNDGHESEDVTEVQEESENESNNRKRKRR